MKHITINELKQMTGSEGLILQGCGGDPQEWIDGINGLLTEQGILKDGSRFEHVSAFEHGGLTNLLFHFDDSVRLDMGKLAMWRLQSHAQFGGTWLSDYLPNKLGVNPEQHQEQEKPNCPLLGADGNVFNLMGIAVRTLKENGMADAAKELRSRVTESGSYDSALAVIMEYVTPVAADEPRQGGHTMRM